MNLDAVKDVIHNITEKFFAGATVIWAEQINTKPVLPYVTLKVGNVNKTVFPVIDKVGNRFYPCSTILEVNLYTRGRMVTTGDYATGNYANTATSDMMDFFKFLESDEMVDYLAGNGIDILLNPPIRDLTELQNDSRYRYRSMAEATVSYLEDANGAYGISDMKEIPNSSGGGIKEMAETEGETFTSAEVTEKEGGNERDD